MVPERSGAPHFAGLTFDAEDSVYVTNFIKFFVGHSSGKAAAQLPQQHFEEAVPLWHRELDELARRSVLPHVIVVLGSRAWPYIWPSLREEKHDSRFKLFQPAQEDRIEWLTHRAARYVVGDGQSEQPLLLVRLKHPGRGQTARSLDALLADDEFRRLAGLVRRPVA